MEKTDLGLTQFPKACLKGFQFLPEARDQLPRVVSGFL